MGVSAHMKMVNGRVDARSADKAAQVLGSQGLTISSFIRNSIEHVARTGEVPESGRPLAEKPLSCEALRTTMRKLESLAMPGKSDYVGLSEDELVERLRMERHGY